MSRVLSVVAAVTLCLLAAAPGFAQRTTGGIAGTVRDGTGAVLPGVTVAVTGANIVGTQTAVTNADGFYRFINLPPGSYQLKFTMSGFATLTQDELRVSVGGTVEQDAALALSSLQDQITVMGDTGVVDTTSSQTASNIGREWVDNAPIQRNSFLDLVAAAPGSLRADETSARTMVYGASYDENSFQIDGTDVNDNFFNEVSALTSSDAVEEIEVLSLGAPAEYGNLTGAVYNVVMRQGTNAYHGDLNFFARPSGLTGDNTRDLTNPDGSFVDACPLDDTQHCPYQRDRFYDLTAQLGGPLVKDKLWFFASYQRQRDKSSPVGVDPNQFVNRTDEANRYFAKLNWQLSAKHKILASFSRDDSRDPYAPGPTSLPSTFVARTAKTPTPGLGYTGVLSDKTVVDVRYGGFYGDVFLASADPSVPKDQPRVYNLDNGVIGGGHYYWYELHPKRTTMSAKVSHLADNFLGGSHDFRFGVQYQDSEAGGLYGYNDLIFTYDAGGSTYGYGYSRATFSYSGNSRGLGVFLDDTFRVSDRLSLNLGVRYDHNKAFSRSQDELDENGVPTGTRFPQADFYTWDYVSPRLGFNLKLTKDGKTVLKGHWGQYHRPITTGEFANVIGPSIKPVFFGLLEPDTQNLVDLEQISDNSNLSVDPDYRSPRVNQLTFSLERELLPNFAVGLNYVHKRGSNFGSWMSEGGVFAPADYVDDQGEGASGRSITVQQLQNDISDLSFVITNRPEMNTTIDAGSLIFNKRMANNWSFTGSVTLLRSTGRTTDSGGPSLLEQRGGLQFRVFGRDPNDFVNTGGRLRGDTPVQLKAQVVYKMPFDLTAAVNVSHNSGANLVRILPVRDVTNLARSRILGEERGELGRLPSVSLVDVRLEKDVKVGASARVGVFADVFNVLGEDAHQGTVSDIGTSSSYHLPTLFVTPRYVMVGAKVKF
jgi:hypothetical protein